MVGFNREGASRIVDAVRQVERSSQTKTPPSKRQSQSTPAGRWARLTESDGAGKYSWVALKPSSSGLTDEPKWGSGGYSSETGFAKAIDGTADAIIQDIVWLLPAAGEDYFYFDYKPDVKFAKLEAGDEITGRYQYETGSGDVLIQKYDHATKQLIDHPDHNDTIRVRNSFTSSVEGPRYIQINYSAKSWFVTAADCDEFEE